MKLHKDPTLADSICDLRTRKIKTTFFTQINTFIDWKEISRLIDKDYSRGKLGIATVLHHVADEEGLVLGVLTTTASKNEISNLEEVLDTADLPEGIPLKADKGYQSKKNEGNLL